MREVIFGMILVGAAGAGVYFMPLGTFGGGGGPDYPLTIGEAKALLAHADLRKGKEPFGRLDVLVTAPGPGEVRYEAGGTFASIDCRANLTAVGDKGVDVATDCKRASPSDGAAASTGEDITGIAFAEYIAAVLGRRPFDEGKVRAQSAGAVFRNLPKMQRDALKMQRDTQKSIDEGANDQGADDAAADEGDAGSAADYGESN